MDSHPKKKKKNQYKANQKSIHSHVVGRENQIQSIQSKSKPNPITQYCNTNLFINKKKNPIQRKPNPKPRANQTQGETLTVTSLAGAARSVARRPCLLVVDSLLVRPLSSLVARASSQIVVDHRSVLGCSGARRSASRYFSLTLSLSLFLTQMKNMNVRILSDVSLSLSLYSSISNLVILSLSFEI